MNSLNYSAILQTALTHGVALAVGYYLGKSSKCSRN